MLKISEMAKLANTTRRTLIFYDEQAIFKPAKKSSSGYRYYNYNQLYDLMMILGLRNIGLSIDQIKTIQATEGEQAVPQLQEAETKISNQIEELQKIEKVLKRRIRRQTKATPAALYVPYIEPLGPATFWCSRKAADCTEQEVAQLFAEFYQELGPLTLMDTRTSGFLTDLPVSNPAGYSDAAFRILKVADPQVRSADVPLIQKPAGRYVRVWVENTGAGIDHGLKALKDYCQVHQLQTAERLWQINEDDALVENGASKNGWLEYALI